MDPEPRLAVFLDYENLAIGSRDNLGRAFDFGVVADALAERGRVITRKAYADWSYFDDDRRMLTRHHVELVDIPQKMGGSRKNAADIKMAVDAVELALDREYISTFVVCTGDSDLSPLVQKLRELDRHVIGVGVRDSTSKLLPSACDEFMFYDNLVGGDDDTRTDDGEPATTDTAIVVSTLAGLESSSGSVRASTLKRAVLRKDPTFSETELGFRGFRALLASLEKQGLVTLSGEGDPEVSMGGAAAQEQAEQVLLAVLADGDVPLTGLKTAMRKRDQSFSERNLGYRTFSSFVRAAEARGIVKLSGADNAQVVRRAG
ncbi:MAG: NYN domain-containing protein [Acidimicrobiia bacterium]|nr:NYN domain-containing protein [Acidimicrobiia bacterium]